MLNNVIFYGSILQLLITVWLHWALVTYIIYILHLWIAIREMEGFCFYFSVSLIHVLFTGVYMVVRRDRRALAGVQRLN